MSINPNLENQVDDLNGTARQVFLKIRSLAVLLLSVYFVSCFLRAWTVPSGSHSDREVTTAEFAVSIKNVFDEAGWEGALKELIFLNPSKQTTSYPVASGDFPFLSLLTFPAFFWSVRAGVFFGSILCFLLGFFASVYSLPKLWSGWNIQLPRWVGPLVYYSLPAIGLHSSIFLPEAFSFPFLLTGVAWICSRTEESKAVSWIPILLCLSTAVTIQPLAVIGYLAVLIWTIIGNQTLSFRQTLSIYLGLALSLIFPAIWFSLHPGAISLSSDLFRIGPIAALRTVGIYEVFDLILKQINSGHFPYFTGFLWLGLGLFLEFDLSASIVLTLIGAMCLLGANVSKHPYCFFGASILPFILIPKLMMRMKFKGLHFILGFLLLWGVLYNTFRNFKLSDQSTDFWKLSEQLVAAIPPDVKVVTDDLLNLPTKLLMTGRVGEVAQERLSTLCNDINYKNSKIAYLLDESVWNKEKLNSSGCLGSTQLLGRSSMNPITWVLVVAPLQSQLPALLPLVAPSGLPSVLPSLLPDQQTPVQKMHE